MSINYSAGLEKSAQLRGIDASQMTIREKLVNRQKMLMEQLADATAAIEFMDKNPSFEKFHDAITKVGIY